MRKFIVYLKRVFTKQSKDSRGQERRTEYVKQNIDSQSFMLKPVEENNGDILFRLEEFLNEWYEFRFNRITETTEYRKLSGEKRRFLPVGSRELNSICLHARRQGIACWDRDVSRYVNSADIPSYHPFVLYMENLPLWDGVDRLTPLAQRVSDKAVWVNGFHRWMLGMTAQWTGRQSLHANSVAPVLVSREQGKHKSTFCKMLIPEELKEYYTDSFDLASVSASEQKLTAFGLINLDEFDKFSPKKMSLLKNLMQMAGLNIRKAYQKSHRSLPRIASFIATSNRKDLLTDPTGSRRFLCEEIHHKIDCSPIEHEQVYAQLKAELDGGVRYWFSSDEEAEIIQNNTAFQRQGMEEDVFYSCFRLPETDEKPQLLSAAYIYSKLRKHNPVAMRETPASQFGKALVSLGVERIHTEKGNLYRVVPTT